MRLIFLNFATISNAISRRKRHTEIGAKVEIAID